MGEAVCNVPFPCTHDFARSIITAFRYLANRINLFVSLPLDKLDKPAPQTKLDEMGKSGS